MFRNVMEIWPGCARPARPTGEFLGLLASWLTPCFSPRSWGPRGRVSHLEGDGGSLRHPGPDPEAAGHTSQIRHGHNRAWWVLLMVTRSVTCVKESKVLLVGHGACVHFLCQGELPSPTRGERLELWGVRVCECSRMCMCVRVRILLK